MRVVGIDLSLTSTGICVVLGHGPSPDISVYRHRSEGRAGATLTERFARLRDIRWAVLDAVGADDDLVVIEAPSLGQSRQAGTHDRAGLWWTVVQALMARGIPVAEVPPSVRAKYATGAGNAGKDTVLAAVVRRYPQVEVSGNDEADALVLAAMGARHLGEPIDSLPQVHLAAMSKVRWPEVDA